MTMSMKIFIQTYILCPFVKQMFDKEIVRKHVSILIFSSLYKRTNINPSLTKRCTRLRHLQNVSSL